MPAAAGSGPTVVRVSPMAHLISGLMAVGLLVLVPVFGNWALLGLVAPVGLSVAIERWRTTADRDGVTARTLLASRRLRWDDIDGLRFDRGGWARACTPGGADVTLPAVTFGTLPQLAEASGGRVPDPYR